MVPYRNGNGVVRRRTEAMPHLSDDVLERYAMGSLPERDMTGIEEHFLICEECQDRLKLTDAYLAAMRSALKKYGNI